MVTYEEIAQRIEQIKCRKCRETAKAVCIMLPSKEMAHICIDSIEELVNPNGNWAEKVKKLKELGVYDYFIREYSRITGISESKLRMIFDNIDKIQLLRDKVKR